MAVAKLRSTLAAVAFMNTVYFKYFRFLSYVEGVSLLLLIFVAMPAKRLLGVPFLTKNLGIIHGILFIAFVYTLISTSLEMKWPKKWIAIAFLCASIPFGTFWLDKKLSKLVVNKKEL